MNKKRSYYKVIQELVLHQDEHFILSLLQKKSSERFYWRTGSIKFQKPQKSMIFFLFKIPGENGDFNSSVFKSSFFFYIIFKDATEINPSFNSLSNRLPFNTDKSDV